VPSWWIDFIDVPDGALVPEPEWLDAHWDLILAATALPASE
jgi:hypothetical protein